MSRTNIVIDDQLIERAMKVTGAKTMRAAVDIALRHVVEQSRVYRALLAARGKLPWSGDLDAWRRART